MYVGSAKCLNVNVFCSDRAHVSCSYRENRTAITSPRALLYTDARTRDFSPKVSFNSVPAVKYRIRLVWSHTCRAQKHESDQAGADETEFNDEHCVCVRVQSDVSIETRARGALTHRRGGSLPPALTCSDGKFHCVSRCHSLRFNCVIHTQHV